MSSTPISRISSALIGSALLARHELRAHGHLGRGERHRLLGDLARHTLELEHHTAGLHDRDPHLGRSFALAHARLGRLLGDRFIRENPDPYFAAALDVARERDTGGFDLASGDPTRLERLESVGAERHFAASMSETTSAALESLAEFDALRCEHCLMPPYMPEE